MSSGNLLCLGFLRALERVASVSGLYQVVTDVRLHCVPSLQESVMPQFLAR